MTRILGWPAGLAVLLGLLMNADTLSAQQGASASTLPADSLMLIIVDRIDATGTIALVTRMDGARTPMFAEVVRSALSAPLVAAVVTAGEQLNRQPAKGEEMVNIAITRKTPLRPVPQRDRARIDATLRALRRDPEREVKGRGLQHAVAVPLHAAKR